MPVGPELSGLEPKNSLSQSLVEFQRSAREFLATHQRVTGGMPFNSSESEFASKLCDALQSQVGEDSGLADTAWEAISQLKIAREELFEKGQQAPLEVRFALVHRSSEYRALQSGLREGSPEEIVHAFDNVACFFEDVLILMGDAKSAN